MVRFTIFQDDSFRSLDYDFGVDISTATYLAFEYVKPDATEAAFTAVLDGTTGITYPLAPGDFPDLGEYRVQPVVQVAGRLAYGDPFRVTVVPRTTAIVAP